MNIVAQMRQGCLFGVGVGPGDPELMTLKAVRYIREAQVVAYFCKKGRRGHARGVADLWVGPTHQEIPLVYPMTTEIPFSDPSYNAALAEFYESSAKKLADRLAQGQSVALLCEGDPMLYGSFMHLFIRLRDRFEIAVCAGVSGMSGCFSAARIPMVWGDDVLSVLPATLSEQALTDRLASTDAAVIMKLGANLPKVFRALKACGKLERAIYVERGTMAHEIIAPLADMENHAAPYFAMVLAPGQGRRP